MANEQLRRLRQSRGWTQAELAERVCDQVEADTGRRPGITESKISQYERGDSSWPRDYTRQAMRAIFGVEDDRALGFFPGWSRSRTSAPPPRSGEEDPVQRREFLQSALAVSIEGAIYRPSGMTRPSDRLREELARAQKDYREARYASLGQRLPRLLDYTQASEDPSLAAAAFNLATEYYVKQGVADMALVTADRAMKSARDSGDPVAKADAAWSLCISLRHSGRPQTAYTVSEDAASDLAGTGLKTSTQTATYGTLYLTASYTAATAGNSALARDYLDEAQDVARRFEGEYEAGMWFFGPVQAALYGISTATRLHDTGQALKHAKSVSPAALPTPERSARYWIDIARVYALDNDRARTRTALQKVATVAPEEANRKRFSELAERVGFTLPAERS